MFGVQRIERPKARRIVKGCMARSTGGTPVLRPHIPSGELADDGEKYRREEDAEKSHTEHSEKTAVPIACRISAPAPVAPSRGSTPKMKVKLVMRIGRSRSRAASMAA